MENGHVDVRRGKGGWEDLRAWRGHAYTSTCDGQREGRFCLAQGAQLGARGSVRTERGGMGEGWERGARRRG